jgi:hypothetical protein
MHHVEPMHGLATFPGHADFDCLFVFTRQLQPTGRLPLRRRYRMYVVAYGASC